MSDLELVNESWHGHLPIKPHQAKFITTLVLIYPYYPCYHAYRIVPSMLLGAVRQRLEENWARNRDIGDRNRGAGPVKKKKAPKVHKL